MALTPEQEQKLREAMSHLRQREAREVEYRHRFEEQSG